MSLQPGNRKYLNDRCISDEVIKKFDITQLSGDSRIAVPIKKDDKIYFYKYRRSPKIKTGPKYTYDSGSKAMLFNHDSLAKAKEVYITEGEFDALVLESNNMTAVSSTGGSGTFNPDWAELFKDKKVLICYDNDEAGRKGMIKVSRLIPHAEMILLPSDLDGKDITDFFQQHGEDAVNQFSMMNRIDHILPPPLELDTDMTKAKLKTLQKQYQATWSFYSEKIALAADDVEPELLEIYSLCQQELANDIKKIQTQMAYAGRSSLVNSNIQDRLERAKSVPCTNYIVFDKGFAKCPWHDERTPSLKFNAAKNKMYCFGGCGPKDVIDLVMLKHEVDFREAVKILLGE